jgi:hypothetical protein
METASTFETADLQLQNMDTSGQYNGLYDNGRWRNIDEAMRLIQFHPDILLDSHDTAKDGGLAIVQGIKDGTARIVSDRSYKKDKPIGPAGTSAFRIAPYANNKEEQCITGYNWVTGTKEDQSSYRSEAAGVSGALAVLDLLVKHYHIESGSVTIALDGLSALQQCTLKTYKTEENLTTAILFILKKHWKRQTIPAMEGDLRLASQHQAEIGWNNFVLGRWSGDPTQISNDTVGLMGIPKWHSTRSNRSIGRRKTYISQLTYRGRFYKRNGRHRQALLLSIQRQQHT